VQRVSAGEIARHREVEFVPSSESTAMREDFALTDEQGGSRAASEHLDI
jgi:hypothetical protein